MVDTDGTRFAIRVATGKHLDAILSWLKGEWDGSQGFWGNRDIIAKGQTEGDLSALVRVSDEFLVGFLLSSDRTMDIMAIKPEFRRQGLGRMLAEHGLRRIEAAGQLGLVIECMPETSIPFWEAFGFRHVERLWGCDRGYHCVYAFPKRFELPPGTTREMVRIEFCPPPHRDELPPQEFLRTAARLEEGDFLLEERIAVFVQDGDTIAKVSVNGTPISDEKVKYSADLGIEYKSGFARIDRIRRRELRE